MFACNSLPKLSLFVFKLSSTLSIFAFNSDSTLSIFSCNVVCKFVSASFLASSSAIILSCKISSAAILLLVSVVKSFLRLTTLPLTLAKVESNILSASFNDTASFKYFDDVNVLYVKSLFKPTDSVNVSNEVSDELSLLFNFSAILTKLESIFFIAILV